VPPESGAALAPTLTSPLAVGAFVGYLVLILFIGALSARFSSRGIGHFFVGGRAMNRWVVALSAVVSGRSAWLLLGVTGMAWSTGVGAIWAVVGYTVVEFVLFLTLAPRLREVAGQADCVTLTDVFVARLGDPRGHLRTLLSAVILLFMAAYVAAQFAGGGKAMAAGFGVDPTLGILLTAGIVLAYTMVGGFLAVSLTDTLQAVFMLGALVVIPLLALGAQGGWAQVSAQVTAADAGFLDPWALGAGALLGLVAIGLGSPGNPHILVRYMSIDDPRNLRFAAFAGTAANILMGAGAVFIGIVGRAHFPDLEALAGDTENLYPMLAGETLPPILFGIVVASIFAAIMSTADSQLLVGASAVVRDLWEKGVRAGTQVADAVLVRLSRLVVAALVVGALFLGWVAQDLVFWMVLFAWAGLGAALGPPLLLTLYWKGTTRAGVLAGVVTGAVVTVAWYYTPALRAMVYELVPAFLAAALVTVGVSLLTGKAVREGPPPPPPPHPRAQGSGRPPPGGRPRPGR
jgi:sodium/proline symporter